MCASAATIETDDVRRTSVLRTQSKLPAAQRSACIRVCPARTAECMELYPAGGKSGSGEATTSAPKGLTLSDVVSASTGPSQPRFSIDTFKQRSPNS